MQVSVENGPGLERRMTVGLESEQIDSRMETRLRELAHSAKVPGFRPGKVPMKILRQRYGESVRREIIGDLVLSSFSEAVAQEDLEPAAPPRIETDMDESAGRYAYTATFEVVPKFELGSLDGKTIKRPLIEVTDTSVDNVVERLREQAKTWSPVERPARLGDQVEVSFTSTVDGEPIKDGSAENLLLELGEGYRIPGFEEGILGMQAGDERRLDLTFPDYHHSDLAGKPAVFEIRVSQVSEPVLPEVNAEFMEQFDFPDGDLDGFRMELRRNIERQVKNKTEETVKERVMDLLLETNRIELPEVLITQEMEVLKQGFPFNLSGYGDFASDFDPDLLQLRERAEQRVRLSLVVTKIVKTHAIELDRQQVRERVEAMASTYEDPQEVVKYYYADEELLAPVQALTLEQQVVDWVLEQIAVEDEPTTWEEFNAVLIDDEETPDDEETSDSDDGETSAGEEIPDNGETPDSDDGETPDNGETPDSDDGETSAGGETPDSGETPDNEGTSG